MVKQNIKSKIIVILGPTSSGKTKLAVKSAVEFNGEIVSADSRQVYRGMDVGTGKDLQEYNIKIPNPKSQIPNKSKITNSKFKTTSIPYHLIDVASPKERFNLADYQKIAFNAIDDVLARKKLPILVGGSGLYLQAVVDNYNLSTAKPDTDLRKKLEKMTVVELFTALKKQSANFANRLNQSDKNNKRRLIRYLEILRQDNTFKSRAGEKKYDSLIIGIKIAKDILKKRIEERLIERLEKQGMIDEVKGLHNDGLIWKKLESFGLEYKFISLYLQRKLDYQEMVEKLNRAINQFARRQMSWFKRWERQGTEINWIENDSEVEKLIKKFIK